MTPLQNELAKIMKSFFPNREYDEKGLPLDITNEEFRELFSSKEYANWMRQCPPLAEPNYDELHSLWYDDELDDNSDFFAGL